MLKCNFSLSCSLDLKCYFWQVWYKYRSLHWSKYKCCKWRQIGMKISRSCNSTMFWSVQIFLYNIYAKDKLSNNVCQNIKGSFREYKNMDKIYIYIGWQLRAIRGPWHENNETQSWFSACVKYKGEQFQLFWALSFSQTEKNSKFCSSILQNLSEMQGGRNCAGARVAPAAKFGLGRKF